MRSTFRRSSDHLAAIDRVTAWTRARFNLPEADAVLVAEVSCALPGCAPLETVIAFWSGVDATGQPRRHHHKIFKPVEAVTEHDLPPAWMKPALATLEDFECGCC